MATITTRRWHAADGSERTAVVVRYADDAGKWRLKTFAGDEAKALKAADAWLARAKVQIADGVHQAESTSITIGEALDLWIERARAEGLERATIQGYEQNRDRLLELIERKTKLAKLSRARCEQLRDALLKHHSRDKAKKLLQSLKSTLAEARRRGLMVADPASATKIGANGRHKPKLRAGLDLPTTDEFKAMLAATEGGQTPKDVVSRAKERALLCLAGIAALRPSEHRGLPWADVDLSAAPTVTITQRADKWGTLGSPKSEAGRRTIELGSTTAQALRQWKAAQPPLVIEGENGEQITRPHALVFGTASDRPDLLGNLQKRVLDKIQERAGVVVPVLEDGKPVLDQDGEPVMAAKYSWHALRHFAITSWLIGGRHDLKTVQHLAGHGSAALTLDLYGHFMPSKDAHARASDHEAALLG